jgi:hypothetical protein
MDGSPVGRSHCEAMPHTEKELWSRSFPVGAPDKEALGKIVEEDHDPAETDYYEAVADPTYVLIERTQRRFRGMLRRRLRHRPH